MHKKKVFFTGFDIGDLITSGEDQPEVICFSKDYTKTIKYIRSANIKDGVEVHHHYIYDGKSKRLEKLCEVCYDNYLGKGEIIQN